MSAQLANEGLIRLLRQHSNAVLLKVDTQPVDEMKAMEGPWVCVDLCQIERGSGTEAKQRVLEFAIWKVTGNVYRVGQYGAVEDDPFIVVTPF